MPPERAWHQPALDGLRSVAFLMVFASHAFSEHLGGFGVTVFFFLSGYLITTLLRREQISRGRINLSAFWIKRALRILPPYVAVLSILIAAGWLTQPDHMRKITNGVYLSLASLTFNYYALIARPPAGPPGAAVYWSLAVEEHFYLLWPLLFLMLARCRSARGVLSVLLGLCLFGLLWRVLIISLGYVDFSWTYAATDSRFDSLLWGCLLAFILDTDQRNAVQLCGTMKRQWLLLAAAALLLALTMVIRDPWYRSTLRYSLQGLALLPLFVVLLGAPANPVTRLIRLRPLVWLAPLTYSGYLVHDGVLKAVATTALGRNAVTLTASALCITIVLSLLIHWLIERPAARLRERLMARRRSVAHGMA